MLSRPMPLTASYSSGTSTPSRHTRMPTSWHSSTTNRMNVASNVLSRMSRTNVRSIFTMSAGDCFSMPSAA